MKAISDIHISRIVLHLRLRKSCLYTRRFDETMYRRTFMEVKYMNHRQLVIFTLIFLFICYLGNSYILTNDTASNSPDIHTQQRIIDRQLPQPDQSVFNQSNVEVPAKE